MISEKDKKTIISIADQYKVGRILLFGSSAVPGKPPGADIDLAVEGLPPSKFFKFYGDLIFSLDKPVDVVDLEVDNKFTRLVQREGIPIYG